MVLLLHQYFIICSKYQNFLLLLFFSLIMVTIKAQNKYALIVGVNNYYNSPGVLNELSLHGCVNDAKSIKGLLVNRFGFSENNITAIYNGSATAENLQNAFQQILNKCKAGDAVVFYFSGHGVWFTNNYDLNDTIKKGMSQAICLSNLYAPHLGCLMRDATLKKIFNQFVDKRVILTSIFDCCFSGNLAMDMVMFRHNNYKYLNSPENSKSMPMYYNLKDPLIVFDAEQIRRPSERFNSGFLSLSGATDVQKGQEITDESGFKHGVFTKALLQVYKTNSASLPVNILFQKIDSCVQLQRYPQTPVYHYDQTRLIKNLIGLNDNGLKDFITAACISSTGNTVVLNAGSNAGILTGNIFIDTSNQYKTALKIIQANEDTAVAVIIKGNASLLKKGDIFKSTDNYTSSAPIIKVYVPQSTVSISQFNILFNKEVLPLTKDSLYSDYKNWDIDSIENIFFNGTHFNKRKTSYAFFIFLPIPTTIAQAIKNNLNRNQNIELVNSINKADMVLYLNYVKQEADNTAGFVFTFHAPVTVTTEFGFRFLSYNAEVSELSANENAANNVAVAINKMCLDLLRGETSRWFNMTSKKIN